MKNVAASVRARLLNHAKQGNIQFQDLLDQYAMGRFLWRLSQSPFHRLYILKGAQLFRIWSSLAHRPTRDLDLMASGPADETTLLQNFTSVLEAPCEPDDGLVWGKISTSPIRQEVKYGGVRAILQGTLDKARVTVQIDVGFGDSILPAPSESDWKELLDFPHARMLAYPPETVIAEKLEAAVVLGIRNSRMKDFFDLDWLCQNMDFDHGTLRRAILATFERRGTEWPAEIPFALTDEFGNDSGKTTQWKAFLRKNRLSGDVFSSVIRRLHGFLVPVIQTEHEDRQQTWTRAAGWQATP